MRVYLGKVQNVMQRYNASSMPLWATEFGASTTGDNSFTEDQQAKALTDLYDLFRHVAGIELAIVHASSRAASSAAVRPGSGS